MFDHFQNKKKILLPVLLTYFLDNFGLAIIYPIFTPLLIGSENAFFSYWTPSSERTILLGLLIAAFPLSQFFGAPLIGQFSDRFGRKKAFYITILGTAVGYTLTAISLTHTSLFGLFISRFATGFFAGNLTLCLAAIADMSPDDVSRTKNFSLISAVGGLSFIIAIAFGGIFSNPTISHHFSPSLPFWITAFFSYLNLLFMIALFEETHPGPKHPGLNPLKGFHHLLQGIRNRELRPLYCVNLLFMMAWIASMQFLPNYLLQQFDLPLTAITFSLMGVGTLWSLTNLILNRKLAKNYFSGKILLLSLPALSFFLLLAFLTRTPPLFILFFLCAASCASLCWTNGLATVSLKAPSAIQGSILGINQSMSSIAAIFGPIIGGFLASFNRQDVYLFGSTLCALAFSLLFIYKAYEH